MKSRSNGLRLPPAPRGRPSELIDVLDLNRIASSACYRYLEPPARFGFSKRGAVTHFVWLLGPELRREIRGQTC